MKVAVFSLINFVLYASIPIPTSIKEIKTEKYTLESDVLGNKNSPLVGELIDGKNPCAFASFVYLFIE